MVERKDGDRSGSGGLAPGDWVKLYKKIGVTGNGRCEIPIGAFAPHVTEALEKLQRGRPVDEQRRIGHAFALGVKGWFLMTEQLGKAGALSHAAADKSKRGRGSTPQRDEAIRADFLQRTEAGLPKTAVYIDLARKYGLKDRRIRGICRGS